MIPLGVDDGVPPPTDAPGARPDRGDGQRGHPDEGHRHAARGVRQAAHRARRRAAAGQPARRPAARPSSSSTGSRSRTRCASCTASPTRSWPRWSGSAEIACVPSLYEGFSLPTAEAMACATPLVVSRAGAIPEVVGPDGVCADLVDARRRRRARTRRSPRCSTTPSAGRRMGAAGRERRWREFSWRAVAEATAAAYQRRDRRTDTEQGDQMLTVDFDRLGLRRGDRVLDMGCGAGRHAFEMFRRGARRDRLRPGRRRAGRRARAVRRDARGRRGAGGRRGRHQAGRRAVAAVRRRRVRPRRRGRGARAHPRRHRRRSPSWCGCCAPAARSR